MGRAGRAPGGGVRAKPPPSPKLKAFSTFMQKGAETIRTKTYTFVLLNCSIVLSELDVMIVRQPLYRLFLVNGLPMPGSASARNY